MIMEQELKALIPKSISKSRTMSAADAAQYIQDGMTIGMSGFTRAGEPKAVPLALSALRKNESFKINLITGASLGSDIDRVLAEHDLIFKRIPYQADPVMRDKINRRTIHYIDQHLSHTAEWIRDGILPPIDIAIIEALTITPDGLMIPTTSVGNTSVIATHAEKIIVEINAAQPGALYGLHDIYEPHKRPGRGPIPLMHPHDRIGTFGIQVDPNKIIAVVFTDILDSPSPITPPDAATEQMAQHILNFLRQEVRTGRLDQHLAPLQAGIGSIANAVLYGLKGSEFRNLTVYSEVLQDAMFDLLEAGTVSFASASAITLTEEKMKEAWRNLDRYRDRLILRPQEISNHPEIIRRLGNISINAAMEIDLYGNVNSTHQFGTHMMNGIGGSGDFARNARISIFVTKSTAKHDRISRIVPFVSHVDHTEHDVDVVVTEYGYADLRGLSPGERSRRIIDLAHPDYRDELRAYVNEAESSPGHTPHVLHKAFAWYERYEKSGSMKPTT